MNYTHIVPGDSAAFLLTRSFELRKMYDADIVSFRDDLRFGPLRGINTRTGIGKRIQWWNGVTGRVDDFEPTDYTFDDLRKMEALKNTLLQNKPICIWFGLSLFDKLMMARLLYFFQPALENIFVIPVSDHIITTARGVQYVPETLGVINSEQIDELFPYLRSVTPVEIDTSIALWKKVESENATSRAWNGVDVEARPDDFYDSALLTNCASIFQKSARVLGRTLIDTNFCVSDTILNWRLKELVRQNKLQVNGILRNMRDYEVKFT